MDVLNSPTGITFRLRGDRVVVDGPSEDGPKDICLKVAKALDAVQLQAGRRETEVSLLVGVAGSRVALTS